MAVQLQTLDPITVAIANQAYPLSDEHISVTSVTIEAEFTNVSHIAIGSSVVTTTNGIQVPKGDTALIEGPRRPTGSDEFFLDEVFVTSSSAGDGVRIVAWKRKP